MLEIRDEDIIIPEGITDIEQYKKWYKLKYIIDNDPERYYTYENKTGDKIVVDLYMPWGRTERRFTNVLPDDIMKQLHKKFSDFKSRNAKCVVEMRKIGSGNGKSYIDPNKLLMTRSTEILELFGKYYSTDEVLKFIHEKWMMRTITMKSVRQFYQRYKDQIARLRAQYEEDYSDISLHSKRARLGQLNYLLQTRRQIYDKTQKIEDSREIRAIIEQAKGEVEGNRLQLDVNGKIDVEVTLNIESQLKQLGGLTLAQMIVSMTAGRLGVNPLYLMSKLSGSVYNKFNGFTRVNPMMKDTPFRPSELIYSFEEAQEENKKKEKELDKQLKIQEIEDAAVIEDAKTIKARMLEKLKKKVDSTNKELQKVKEGLYD